MALTITPIPAFNDNYIWALHQADGQTVVVDPGDAEPVKAWLSANGATLAGILITHHHPDHTGGLDALLAMTSPVPVYGPAGGHIRQINHTVKEGDQLSILDHDFEVLETPGHTLDHIVYFHPGASDTSAPDDGDTADLGNPPWLFCGDTLFAGGCGRIFEGNPAMMYGSLQKLASLPAATQVYCAHEYTLANLAFAASADPDNGDLKQRQVDERNKRDKQHPTLPSTICLEQRTNPFLRCHSPSLQATVEQQVSHKLTSGLELFTALRRLKDQA
ncbi:hydroxyacylglutathione hydrolase [Pseudohongiella acticola]|uniref:Hydroxyacylglutathione hydrolase n=1 Tax=Pseudohongiella acticola TaxID=1524254 RepID=A0A1E8CHI6_9GAMM|nr:hydroxyacylglutathione hydrolase [Pseudohongiella acticola]OFE11838.1 hydroxyacylglutathione hydrolase [Pseudohongiella acticola]